MTNKVVIIGKGTAGAMAMMHMYRWLPRSEEKPLELEWHYDPNIQPQAVGEGSTLVLPRSLYAAFDFTAYNLPEINGTPKYGILKENWGENGQETFFHPFGSAEIGYHFNAIGLQNYVFNAIKDHVKIVEAKVDDPEELDCTHVIDCSGTPKDFTKLETVNTVAVNSVYVTQCWWSRPEFYYTLAIARPYGWVFGIPLTNRCSIGYMYNNTINTLEEVKEDVKYIFDKWNLTPSDTTNSFSFKNYTRKSNFTDKVTYSGNNSFFLEPLEATSITTMDYINRMFFDIYVDRLSLPKANESYKLWMDRTRLILALHYCSGSKFNTPFWQYAREQTLDFVTEFRHQDSRLFQILQILKQTRDLKTVNQYLPLQDPYSTWWIGSFKQNIEGLGIEDIVYDGII